MSTTTSRVIVPARYLVALENCQSDEPTRYYLRGIHIKPHADGAMMAATNGHIMGNLLARGAIVEGEPQIWAVKAKKLLGPIIRAHETKDLRLWCDMTFADGKVSVSLLLVSGETDEPADPLGGVEIATLSAADAASVIDGTFPDADRLWRASKWNPNGAIAPAFGPLVLKALLAFSAALDSPRASAGLFRCWRTGEDCDHGGPSLVTFTHAPDACVMMMPMRETTAPEPDKIGWLRDILGHNENWVAKALDEKKAA